MFFITYRYFTTLVPLYRQLEIYINDATPHAAIHVSKALINTANPMANAAIKYYLSCECLQQTDFLKHGNNYIIDVIARSNYLSIQPITGWSTHAQIL